PADNTYIIYARFRDPMNNSTITPSHSFTLDTMAPSAPTVTSCKFTGSGKKVTLSWGSNPDPTVKYNVYRATTNPIPSGTVSLNGPAISATSWSDTPPTNNTTYYYRIDALDLAGNAAPSSVQTINFSSQTCS